MIQGYSDSFFFLFRWPHYTSGMVAVFIAESKGIVPFSGVRRKSVCVHSKCGMESVGYCGVIQFVADNGLAKYARKKKRRPQKGTGAFFSGSGGSLCTLARSSEPFAVLEVPLIAA